MISMSNDKLRIKIKTVDSDFIELEMRKNNTILQVKTAIRQKNNMPIINQKLIFQGKVLKDADTLSTYHIEDNDVIHLVHTVSHSNAQTQESPRSSRLNGIMEYLNILSSLTNSINNLQHTQNLLSTLVNNRQGNQQEITISDSFAHLVNPENFNMCLSYENIVQNINNINVLLSSEKKVKITDLNKVTELYVISNRLNRQTIKFQLGQWVDVMDPLMNWAEAQIINIDHSNNKGQFHYIGCSRTMDEWISLDSPRITLHRVHTIQSPFSRYYSPFPNKNENSNVSIANANSPFFYLKNVIEFINVLKDKIIYVIQLKEKSQSQQKEIEQRQVEEKEFYFNIMQLYPIMDRIGRLMVDYAMMMMNYSFKYFNENYSNFNCNIINDNNNRNNLQINTNELLKLKIKQYEQITKISVMRNNGEVAQTYHFSSSQNGNNVRRGFNQRNGGANFQRQLQISNQTSMFDIPLANANNRTRIISNNINSNEFQVDYLNQVCYIPDERRIKKFCPDKTKIIHREQFSICHYNKFPIMTFSDFTQTFPVHISYSIGKTVNVEYICNNRNKNKNLRTSINKFSIDAGVTHSSLPTIKKSGIISRTSKKYKLLK